ncbi:MAG TPA: hypothetical protein VFM70_05655 [Salinimicrobium sp.]|nr:hypothetical protein [Salinimicrobium sp.]
MNIRIDIKSFFLLTLVFILFTVIGTISHEYGHIAIAKMLGYETKLHYGSMNYYPRGYLDDNNLKALKSITKEYADLKYESWPKEIKEKTEEHHNILQQRYWSGKSNKGLLVTIGGPIQTIITGIIGLIILLFRRKTIHLNGLKFMDWLSIFLSLFWLREIFNLVTSIGGEIISPDGTWFGGDELKISQDLDLWSGTIPIILGILGILVSVFTVFVIVPKKLRLTFIVSGFIGSISGFILWMNILGPKILP